MPSIFIKNISDLRFLPRCSRGGTKNWERRKNSPKALVLKGFTKNFPFPLPDLSFQPQPLFHKGFPLPTIYYVYIGMFLGTHTYIRNVNNKTGGIQKLSLEDFA